MATDELGVLSLNGFAEEGNSAAADTASRQRGYNRRLHCPALSAAPPRPPSPPPLARPSCPAVISPCQTWQPRHAPARIWEAAHLDPPAIHQNEVSVRGVCSLYLLVAAPGSDLARRLNCELQSFLLGTMPRQR
jgi:hypothetical protein